jgi:hypothetical protein
VNGTGAGGLRSPFLSRFRRASSHATVRACLAGEVAGRGTELLYSYRAQRDDMPVSGTRFDLSALAALDETGACSPIDTCRGQRREGFQVGLHCSCDRQLTSAWPATADPADRRRGRLADLRRRKAAWKAY